MVRRNGAISTQHSGSMKPAAQAAYQVIWLSNERLRCATHGGHAGAGRLCRGRQAWDDADLVILKHLPHPGKGIREGLLGTGAVCASPRMKPARHGRHISIAVAGCVAQAEGNEIIRRATGGRCGGRPAKAIIICRNCWPRAKSHGPCAGDRIPGRTTSSDSWRRRSRKQSARRRHFIVRHRTGRLRQVLHLLRGALYARRGSVGAPVARIVDDVLRLADNGRGAKSL